MLRSDSEAVDTPQSRSLESMALADDNIGSAVRLWYDSDENDRTMVEQIYGGPIESWDTSAITSLEEAFIDLSYFEADLSQWNVSGVTSMRAAFYNTTGFSGQVGQWDVSNVQDMRVLLAYASDFQDDIGQWDAQSVQTMLAAFTEYYSTEDKSETLPISSWRTPSLTDMEGLFAGTQYFQTDLSGWDTSSVTNMAYLFERTDSFYGGDLSLLDTSSVVTMEGMFQEATNVRAAHKISRWDVSNAVDMRRIFFNSTIVNDYDTTGDIFIFYLCWDLSGLEPDVLSEAFCHSNAGGFNCDCVPADILESINSVCEDTQKDNHCYASLGESEASMNDAVPGGAGDEGGAVGEGGAPVTMVTSGSGSTGPSSFYWGAMLLSIYLGFSAQSFLQL